MQMRRLLVSAFGAMHRPPTAATLCLCGSDGAMRLDGPGWMARIDGLRREGHRSLLLASRPLVHPDLADILRYAGHRFSLLLVDAPARVRPETLRGLPPVDTFAQSCAPAHVDAALTNLTLLRHHQPRATLEVLLDLREPAYLVDAVARASRAGALVFLTPSPAATWGDPPTRPSHADAAALRRALSQLSEQPPPGLMSPPAHLRALLHWLDEPECLRCPTALPVTVDSSGALRPCRSRGGVWREPNPHGTSTPSEGCLCPYDDYIEHGLWREAPGQALRAAVRRGIVSLRQRAAYAI